MKSIEAFGIVTGSAGLALAIYKFCEGLKGSSGNERLITQIRYDAVTLKSFAETFGTAIERPDIKLEEKALLEDICIVLQPLLEKLNAWIKKKQRMQKSTTSFADKLADEVISVLFLNADIRKLARELTSWTERYHIRLGLLPLGLKEKLLTRCIDSDRPESHRTIRQLRSTFERLSIAADSVDSSYLVKQGEELRAEATHSRVWGELGEETVLVE